MAEKKHFFRKGEIYNKNIIFGRQKMDKNKKKSTNKCCLCVGQETNEKSVETKLICVG